MPQAAQTRRRPSRPVPGEVAALIGDAAPKGRRSPSASSSDGQLIRFRRYARARV